MKRIVFLAYLFLIISFCFAEQLDQRTFALEFSKKNVTSINFYRDSSLSSTINSVNFELVDGSDEYTISEEFYIGWKVEGSYKLSLILSATPTPENTGFCLIKKKDNIEVDGLNSVLIKGFETSSDIATGKPATWWNDSSCPIDERTYSKEVTADGYELIQMQINAPTNGDSKAFMEGPYNGYLILKLETV